MHACMHIHIRTHTLMTKGFCVVFLSFGIIPPVSVSPCMYVCMYACMYERMLRIIPPIL